jgi:hypothetical protein
LYPDQLIRELQWWESRKEIGKERQAEMTKILQSLSENSLINCRHETFTFSKQQNSVLNVM